ncbi:MAG: ATP phosphoribosyltransferase regulatory subunit [Gammaproteobacteria bacterium]|nr:ATP phosphoribosyltransferase regulatory subunit [Gammaproteobacteria bacterium]MCW8839829.1 ATP phosphoribosyltransferase regulatory subunit [Gammaproteobacteria bacterium]MCW8928326.1 ATP phosphoribosyltransferase regulatory subunit [Gammaproteobacteria bacterium]MCW8959587.1 ATP phosphoribosyltransferase regulatory subunit [Gammaproteobacteria bacterium]MCW8971829.1 ATP phosphoribosyltransferase regulatory subunit [Gammaproteobacteria bacterium]
MQNDRWLLPEGIEEVLPPRAEQMETTLRRLLDLLKGWGYELVMPPFIEYLESLLTGTGNDLDLQTFKLTDQLTGRLMGVRSDMTPQVARIDAHCLKRDLPTRLCYMGTVLRTLPPTHGGNRSPMQVGAELYGHAGVESDLEVLRLMVRTLHTAGIEHVYLDIGHVGIFRGLAHQANLDSETEARLFDALQRKAKPEIATLLAERDLPKGLHTMLERLADLHGDRSVLEKAASILAEADEPVHQALDNLRQIAEVAVALPGTSVHFDLAELRGYHYHTGVVFAAFVPGQGQAIAQGGRYDEIGKVFGQARPATGFSTDLKTVLSLSTAKSPEVRGIFAPCDGDAALVEAIDALREAGERVIQALPGQQGGAVEMGCDRELVLQSGGWQTVAVHK